MIAPQKQVLADSLATITVEINLAGLINKFMTGQFAPVPHWWLRGKQQLPPEQQVKNTSYFTAFNYLTESQSGLGRCGIIIETNLKIEFNAEEIMEITIIEA